jgi:hypothetical protein
LDYQRYLAKQRNKKAVQIIGAKYAILACGLAGIIKYNAAALEYQENRSEIAENEREKELDREAFERRFSRALNEPSSSIERRMWERVRPTDRLAALDRSFRREVERRKDCFVLCAVGGVAGVVAGGPVVGLITTGVGSVLTLTDAILRC